MGSSMSVQFTGFVGQDAVLKEVGEQRVASFSLAVNRKTSSGQQQTLWVRVNAWNGLSDVVMKYVRKSSLIQVESSWMQLGVWIDKNGEFLCNLRKTLGVFSRLSSNLTPQKKHLHVGQTQNRIITIRLCA